MIHAMRNVLLLSLLAAPAALAQEITVPAAAWTSDSALAAAMPGMAEQVMAVYREDDRDRYLDNRFRLQLVTGRYPEAIETLTALRDLRRAPHAPLSPHATLPYEIYLHARSRQQALPEAFRTIVGALDDTTASYEVRWIFGTSINFLRRGLRAARERQQGKTAIPLPDAVDLVRRHVAVHVYESFQPLLGELLEQDDQRRYIIERNIPVRAPDGATICALVMRPRRGTGRVPALLNFTIYADAEQNLYEARRTAAHGYAGVEGLTRGKGCSPDQPVPIEHDGADARTVIEWISRQPWSDGRVGMYGGSYEGFTQWAAAKQMPPALKAFMPSVTFAPGVDFPMDGNIFMNYAYPWPFYTANGKTLDATTYFDAARWERLNREWYVSGRRYRSLDSTDGTPNPIFRRWLEHPTYDAYWQRVMPYQRDFARIDIPVLTTTGYYDSGQIGALHYFRQHYQYNPAAEHYLVIGPYDHIGGQRGTISPLGTRTNVLRGYTLDSVAHIDIGALRYQWFDYVFRGAPKPSILKDKVNYQVMGANVWRHAPSLDAMGKRSRLYLTSEPTREGHRLSGQQPGSGTIRQEVDLADRSDVTRFLSGELIDQALDTWSIVDSVPRIGHGLVFVSDPLQAATEVSGLFSGRLDVIINKRDFDFSVTLFERTPRGEYVQLSYYWARASHVGDRSRRRLLVPGERRRLEFVSGRLTSRLCEVGSRLVVVVGVIKQPGEQINYGTGRDVSDETIEDAKEPLRIQWLGGSFVDLPFRRR